MSKAGSGSDPNTINTVANVLGSSSGGAGLASNPPNASKRHLPAFALPGLKRLQQAQSAINTAPSATSNIPGVTPSSTHPIMASAPVQQAANAGNPGPGIAAERAADRYNHSRTGAENLHTTVDAKKKTPLVRRKKACIPIEVAEPLGLVATGAGVGDEGEAVSEARGSPKQVKKKNCRDNINSAQGDGACSTSFKKKASTKKAKEASNATSVGGTKSLLSQVQENLHNATTGSGISRSELPPVDYYTDGADGILIEDIGEGFSFF
ncbi:hypothetical protein EON65_40720 [archaeon]|nr:MAG: hypothetical protein EON65_40720 [archaeon]